MRQVPILAGIIGSPVSHSLSPLIHTIWAHRAKIDGYYIPVEVAPDYDDFTRAIEGLRKIGFAGVNVTIPHKEHALACADEVSEAARVAGAANMLTFSGNNIYADNSDMAGFESAVRDIAGVPAGARALVLGAGGASRGVVLALQKLGVKAITITNRTEEKAETVAAAFSLKTAPWADRSDAIAEADIIVNTTSLGMEGQPPLALDISGLKPAAIIADIVYAPLATPLLAAAKAKGNQTVDGLSMLMHQAAPGFVAWFGGKAKVDAKLRAELVAELERRKT